MSDTSEGAPRRPGYDMVIERGKVREFATSVKSTNPGYLDDPNPVIPPTFLRAASFWAPRRGAGGGGGGGAGRSAGAERGGGAAVAASRGRGAAGGGMGRVLHGGQEYVFHGPPPRAGDVLTITSRTEDSYEKEGSRGGKMTFTISVQEFRDAQGNLVAEGRSTNIVTSKATTE